MALYDSGSRDILLMTADDSANPQEAAAAARRLLNQGAEVIVGSAVRRIGDSRLPPSRATAACP
ncbi:MAG: hypothetical protein WDM89_08790 [Rhizomicrobium sp.]